MGEIFDISSKGVIPTEKPCRHRLNNPYCQLGYTAKCCACVDKKRRFNANTASAQSAAVAVVNAATSTKPKYSDYCHGCVNYHSEVDAQIVKKKKEGFAKWQRMPDTNTELTKIHANFALRKAGLPFELTHLVLAFALKEPLVRFFKTFDQPGQTGGKNLADPGTAGVVVSAAKAATLNNITPASREDARARSSKCTHKFCCNSQGGAYTTRYYDYASSSYKTQTTVKACCACMDARPNKKVDVMYIDGRGNVLMEVDFFVHYCRDCKDHWQARPGCDPFGSDLRPDEQPSGLQGAAESRKRPSVAGLTFVSHRK